MANHRFNDNPGRSRTRRELIFGRLVKARTILIMLYNPLSPVTRKR
jgi:hypothetical protein